MKLAFYKIYNNPDIEIIPFLIGLITFGRYSHVEIVFELGGTPQLFSIDYSSNRPRFVDFSVYSNRPLNEEELLQRWDFLDIDIDKETELKIYKECLRLSKLNVKYDVIGAMFSIFRPHRDLNSDRYFCSELCSLLLKYGGIQLNKEPQQYTPVGLHNELKSKK